MDYAKDDFERMKNDFQKLATKYLLGRQFMKLRHGLHVPNLRQLWVLGSWSVSKIIEILSKYFEIATGKLLRRYTPFAGPDSL